MPNPFLLPAPSSPYTSTWFSVRPIPPCRTSRRPLTIFLLKGFDKKKTCLCSILCIPAILECDGLFDYQNLLSCQQIVQGLHSLYVKLCGFNVKLRGLPDPWFLFYHILSIPTVIFLFIILIYQSQQWFLFLSYSIIPDNGFSFIIFYQSQPWFLFYPILLIPTRVSFFYPSLSFPTMVSLLSYSINPKHDFSFILIYQSKPWFLFLSYSIIPDHGFFLSCSIIPNHGFSFIIFYQSQPWFLIYPYLSIQTMISLFILFYNSRPWFLFYHLSTPTMISHLS